MGAVALARARRDPGAVPRVLGLRSAGVVGAATGTLAIETDPAGLDVIVDGRAVGRSPIELALPEGMRSVGAAARRAVAYRVGESHPRRDRAASLRVRGACRAGGGLERHAADNERPLARRTHRGTASPRHHSADPAGPRAGAHAIAVRFSTATVEQRVEVAPGRRVGAHRRATGSGTAGRLLAVTVASPLQIFEQDKLVGTTNIGRLLLPPGPHVLDFVSDGSASAPSAPSPSSRVRPPS
jgi:hypothetical protein